MTSICYKIYTSLTFSLLLAVTFGLSSCINEDLDPSCYSHMEVGDILCTDGSVLTLKEFTEQNKTPVAVVYYVNPDRTAEIVGYAVYLKDISDEAFAETLGVKQNTSKDIYALDGNENTYAIYKAKQVKSPMALPVFDLWTYGQSAYIPSAQQLRQLQLVHNFINPRIEALGGQKLSNDPDECWYWSSTEVEGQEDLKAWLVSMNSGIIHETPKDQKHHCRPVVTIYRHNGNPYYRDEELENISLDLNLSLSVDSLLTDYKTINKTDFTTRDEAQWQLKYFVAAYRNGIENPVFKASSVESKIKLDIPPGEYQFVAWAEKVQDPDGKTYYFHTDDFSEMLLKHKYDYKGCDPIKTPYHAVLPTTVLFTTKQINMELKPAFGQYRLIATDTASFTPGEIKVTYYQIPSSVNALTGDINVKWSDVSFRNQIDNDVLAFDNVISSAEETTVVCMVEIFDNENNLKCKVDNLSIPMINGGITTIKGNFYSMLVPDVPNTDLGSSGGVKIDPEWEATVEIVY